MKRKKCWQCKKVKSLDEFKRNSNAKDEHTITCFDCLELPEQIYLRLENNKQCSQFSIVIRARYGLSPKARDRLWFLQGGVCAVCKKKPKRFAIDHDHATGEVRGLLCHSCNVTLGKVKDKPAVGTAFHDYLANPPAKRLRQYFNLNMQASCDI